jgi:predicted dehydrogenase
VCNSTPESSKRAADKFGIRDTAGSWEELVERDDVDVVWIGTTPFLHEPVSVAALESGKHVFCQARMAMNLAEARRMLEVRQKHPDRVAMLCPPPMGMKHGAYFKKLLEEQRIGELYHFRFYSLLPNWVDGTQPLHWRQDKEASGLNILSVGIYAEVIGYWLGYPKSISARVKVCRTEQAGRPVEVPDVVSVSGEWENHLLGSLDWSGVARFAPDDRLEIYGERGVLIYDFNTDDILLGIEGDEQTQVLDVPPEFVKDWTVEDDFIDAVLHGGCPEPTFETGVKYMEFVEAAHLSASLGQSVELPLK